MNSKTLLLIAAIAVLGYYFFMRDKKNATGNEEAFPGENPPDSPPGNAPTTGKEKPEPGDADWPIDPDTGEPLPYDENGEPVYPAGGGESVKVSPTGATIKFSAPKVASSGKKGITTNKGVTPDRNDIVWTQYGFSSGDKGNSTRKFKGVHKVDSSNWLKVEKTENNVMVKRDIFPDDGKMHFSAPTKAK